MREMGYGEEYHYAHDAADGYIAGESYLPVEMEGKQYYYPVPRGLEIRIGEKLASLRELDNKSSFQRGAHQPGDDKTPEENNK
jgi:putative ATPase